MELEEILFLAWLRQQLEAELKTLILFAECHSLHSEKCRIAIPEQRGWRQGETRMEHAGVVGWPDAWWGEIPPAELCFQRV